jgi:hypothetical protein
MNQVLTVTEAIPLAWTRLCDRVEVARDLDFDHEFTLQFHLAWEVARLLGFPENLGVRFEVPCGRDADGETIRLDLLLWTDPRAKVAVELKAPLRSETGMNSAMTQFRMRFYRDIHRLWHLVNTRTHDIVAGYFVAVVNEKGYIIERAQKVNREYRTYHGIVLPPSHVVPADPGPNGYKFDFKMPPHEIRWDWLCDGNGVSITPPQDMRYFWLTPIFVHVPDGR